MINPLFTPFPKLQTPRLLLRQVTTDDAPEIFFLRSDPGVLEFIDRTPAASLQDAIDFIGKVQTLAAENVSILWGIELKESQQLVGSIGFWQMEKENHRAEIGYVLHPSFHRKGIMSEALGSVIKYGFEVMKLHSICANINPANEASRNLLKKTGFRKEAYFHENYFFNGKFLDSEIYGLLSTDDFNPR